MKWAQAHEVSPPLFELNVLAHHVDNVGAGEQVLDKALRNGHVLLCLKVKRHLRGLVNCAGLSRALFWR
ncbi:MAG: hypothetical protein ACJA1Y_001591 [Burkholderiaceae bacterium]|jgi:hypothetical protein